MISERGLHLSERTKKVSSARIECVSLRTNADFLSVSAGHCDAIAESRRKLQRLGLKHVLFLDETHLRVSEAPRTTLVASGEQPFVIVEDTTAYAARYDMIACCTADRVLPPIIWSPADRKDMKVKGINKKMLLDYIQDTLAQACSALDEYPLYLVMDKARIHNISHILEAFHEAHCQEMKEIILLPTQAAKRMSPLDNALFHDWKEACRKEPLLTDRTITRVMSDAWNNISPRQIRAYYKHCLITGRTDVYADCPAPDNHHHDASRQQNNPSAR